MTNSGLAWMDLVEDVTPDASGNVAILKLKQDLTFSNLTAFQTFVRGILRDGRTTLKLDFSEVRFIDSAGVGAMAALHKTAKSENGELVLLNPNTTVRSILKIVGLDRIIRFEVGEVPQQATPRPGLKVPPPPKASPTSDILAAQSAQMTGVRSELSEGEKDQDVDDAVSQLLLNEMTVQSPTSSAAHVTPQIMTVQLKENVTYRNATMVSDGFLALLRKGVKTLRAEMSRVDFVDSAGVAALMKVARSFSQEGGELILLAPSPSLVRILKIAKLDRVIKIENS